MRKKVGGLRKPTVHFFAMSNFQNNDQEDLILDFIDNAIISNSDPMKWVVPLHLGFGRFGRTFGQAFNPFCNPFLSCFWHGLEGLYRRFGEFYTEGHKSSSFLSSSQETVSSDSARACHVSSTTSRGSSLEGPGAYDATFRILLEHQGLYIP